MRKLLFILCSVCLLQTNAQTTKEKYLRIYTNDGNKQTIKISTIDSMKIDTSSVNVEPTDSIVPENIFSSETYLKSALSAAYQSYSYSEQYLTLIDASICKQISCSTVTSPLTSENIYVSNAFSNCYKSINYLNIIIGKLGSGSFSYDVKPYIATSKTLRALNYLNLVQHWGNVPYIDETNNNGTEYFSQTAAKDILLKQKDILLSCFNYLKEHTDVNNVILSKAAAQSILMQIAMETNDVDAMDTTFISDGSYGFSTDNWYKNQTFETMLDIWLKDGLNLVSDFKNLVSSETYYPIFLYSGNMITRAALYYKSGDMAKAKQTVDRINNYWNGSSSSTLTAGDIANLWKSKLPYRGYFILLKQLGTASSTLGINDYQQLYPFPEKEVGMNPKLIQNPGY